MGWGNVNAALNRLTREGIITGFKTNFGRTMPVGAPHVIITAAGITDAESEEAVRRQVASVLEPVIEGCTITVDRSGQAASS